MSNTYTDLVQGLEHREPALWAPDSEEFAALERIGQKRRRLRASGHRGSMRQAGFTASAAISTRW